MTFYIEGRTNHELMPVDKLFDKQESEKAHNVDTSHPIDGKDIDVRIENNSRRMKKAYKQVAHFIPEVPVIFAEQIMTTSVMTVTPDSSINHALNLFHKYKFRHIPVISSNHKLQGIISDRDILRELGLSQREHKKFVADVMTPEVLTASRKTDIRYITRLFIENRIGSIPIMEERRLIGIITRSDVLRAILNHYELELWI